MSMGQNAISHAFGVLEKTGLSRLLAPFTRGCGALFMMHHVREARPDAFQPNRHLEITPEFLRQAVERIRANGYEIIALDEAIDLLKTGYGDQRYAVLTFDDGYRDNLEIAYPVLKALEAPFTVFVASGLVDRTTELWWTALERIIAGNDEVVFSDDGETGGVPCGSVAEKESCFRRLADYLTLEVEEPDQRQIIRALCETYGVDLQALADELMMSWDEVRELASDPLVTIGAHTHDHFALARLQDSAARADVLKGVSRLEQEIGLRPKHFAYPYGKSHAVSQRDAGILREVGFASSVTTAPGVLQSVNARDLMMLPRVSLNGRFQDPAVVDQYLTGAPFALYRAARWVASGFGVRSGFSRLFPSTR
ncbi:polysaccharide deacetylase family protein [Labrenzia sp. 011]|uniref:polysaccharide deacetylase family protein n=1 Tax=Labrenzia sp. 011 TaxID=2171494 RepID=UPI000D515AF0|nr:polysaccharide deacetylase family protein [Labrenzia sp. 011]PVB63304.1 polysaccharide deacetylase [Labrenzia sp. 011]